MKRIATLTLVLALLLSLCACGDSTLIGTGMSPSEGVDPKPVEGTRMTKEEMLAEAMDVDISDVVGVVLENKAKAKQLYCDKVLLLEGCVISIEEDYIIFNRISTGAITYIAAYLPLDDLVNLEIGQIITIVVKTEPEIKEKDEGPYTIEYYEALQAYLVKDTTEWVGTLVGKNDDYENAYNFLVDGTTFSRVVYFIAGTDIPSDGTRLKIAGKEISHNGLLLTNLHESQIIEILE